MTPTKNPLPKRTKIVATIGPASDSKEIIRSLALAGVNVFRLNFSHGSHEYHKTTLDRVRSVESELNLRLGILQDIAGPKIRVSTIEKPFELKKGDILHFHEDRSNGSIIKPGEYRISINQSGILALIKKGDFIHLCDGMISTIVTEINDGVVAVVQNEGILSSNKGVNFPNTKLGIDIITPKDRLDLEWGAQNGVDFVAISFVQSASDMTKAREILQGFGSSAKLFAKIEKFDAVEHIDEIIEASDGIMVARGDLGIEVPYYQVPPIQKMIISKSNRANKPVITATQMMFSMAKNAHATRAEISDVANAVLDGTDAVMLSEESAVGINPVAVVEAMNATILESERFYPYGKFDFDLQDETDKVAVSTVRLAHDIKVESIIPITSSGQSALKISAHRPKMDILAVTHDVKTARALTIAWGVNPCLVAPKDNLEKILTSVISALDGAKLLNHDLTHIITAGYPVGVAGSTNFIRILRKDQIDYYLNLRSK
ncbi:MAG: pyruvate kinase [Helicobacter sp.]|nr:pyruvate kinase [Helicobacter sp.]